ncbi:hypothetical protein SLEP1_g48981 [Rubroshorea leprosula]|uniref:RING-type domain-containing protein n=1 Tax=Rubroshorea leprosula TaxID=152421 RepID=A0AAV5LW48_9ROSI|nr:hypothetical protein SLEP1_g48981 [Rubroshorea leprosula]
MREALLRFSSVLFFLHLIEFASATVLLRPYSAVFPDLPAKFGRNLNSSGICGALVVVDPENACSSLRNGVRSNRTDQKRFALIVRGDCAFEEKIRNAQDGGFDAAIVYDDRNRGSLVYMMVDPKEITVHAVFVSKAAGEFLKEYANGEEGECCIFPPYNGRAWTVLAIYFITVLAITVFLVITFLTPRNWLNWHGRDHFCRSVDSRMVERLPRFAFNSAHFSQNRIGETCAICLEDYKDGEVVKVLPCQHDFHSGCVDSWLTKWGTFCPVCKLDMTSQLACSEVKRAMQH